MFPVEKDSGCVSLGIFWRCKIDEILTIILDLVLRMILLIWFSSKVRNLLRKCLRSTASPLCHEYVIRKGVATLKGIRYDTDSVSISADPCLEN